MYFVAFFIIITGLICYNAADSNKSLYELIQQCRKHLQNKHHSSDNTDDSDQHQQLYDEEEYSTAMSYTPHITTTNNKQHHLTDEEIQQQSTIMETEHFQRGAIMDPENV